LFDPFPEEKMMLNNEEFSIPIKEDDLVYGNDRYIYKNSPNMLYFPSKSLLFKLMRACVGIVNEDDLWF
jgi:hypothetical protein